MTPQQFIAKWQAANLSERSACQQHFLDLCDLLGQEKPAAADPEGAWYCFERGVSKTEGGQGWADVWMRNHFGWEYKGKHKDLKAAYAQLLQYRESLDNPPLLVVCDLNRFEVHTNFTGTAKRVHAFDLAGLAEPKNLDVLRRLFADPESLRPGLTSRSVTEQAAELFGKLADGLWQRKIPADEAAHFLMRLMFCMFAEDIDLLPSKVFSRTLAQAKKDPARLSNFLRELFGAMASGGTFALEEILYFNGGLFSDSTVIDLTAVEIQVLADVAAFDWSVVEPHIFGTLFERTLDPAKRAQIGAHYTSSDDIKTLVEPVMMTPLRREWQAVQEKCHALLVNPGVHAGNRPPRRVGAAVKRESKPRREFNKLLRDFVERLAHVTVLDPACGSGNFLYVALRLLLDLEKEVITFAAGHGLGLLPQVRPTQLHGIEINPFAQELAQVVIWIGYLQWMRDNGFNPPRDPVLEPIESIENKDAILDLSDPEHPQEPTWPAADFIVGNPPFLGNRYMAAYYDRHYLKALYRRYEDRLGGRPDLCCYWFEKARSQVSRKKSSRAGLLATQGIRGGTNRNVLQRIKDTGDIFFAVSDREWLLDGAMVHVSLVGFDDGSERARVLDGQSVADINPNLTSGSDTTTARHLPQNDGIAFQGGIKRGSFDFSDEKAHEFLRGSGNPNNRPNSDVLRPYLNATDVTQQNRHVWIIHFGKSTPQQECAAYEAPFRHVEQIVKEERATANQMEARERWWLHWNVREELERTIAALDRCIVTPRVAKHRVFAWITPPQYIDNALVAFATADDYLFGVLHSRIHEVWSLAQGTQLREKESGFRYTPTTCFETFPFPEPSDAQRGAIAEAARQLDQLRTNWLNPPEWTRTEILEFPGSVDGPWARYISRPLLPEGASGASHGAALGNADAIAGKVPPGRRDLLGTVHYPRLVPKDDECAKELKKRTLTNLYNQRPAWLDLAHQKLDAAVFAAYGWPTSLTDDELLARLLELNLGRTARS
ncbi:MAG TPA: DNA methyltransferase [Pirellulaceae bacterium]|nr:DNA methyltransferase [Pirellulaceae bacterium]